MASLVWTITLAVAFIAIHAEATCPSGYQLHGSRCYQYFSDVANFDDAVKSCAKTGGILAEPRNEEEQKSVAKFAQGKYVWLGSTDREVEGTFNWLSDKQEIVFSRWNGGEPNNYGSGEDCNMMRGDGKWNDLFCNRKINYVCQTEQENVLTAVVCPNGYKLHGSRCYHFSAQDVSFDDGVAYCEKTGGILAEPRNEEEQKSVAKLAQGKYVWLGSTDREVEGTFKWLSDKQEIVFSRWNGGEPNNYGSGEDCNMMRGDGTWNDLFCDRKIKVVCQANPAEVSTVANDEPISTRGMKLENEPSCPNGYNLYGDNCYQFLGEDVNFDDGVAYCEKTGGILAEPRNEEEQNVVAKLAQGKYVWLGSTDREVEGTFKWLSDKQEIVFSKWNGGEPNNYGSGEDCNMMRGDGKWNDLFCNRKIKVVCQIKPSKVCPRGYDLVGSVCYQFFGENVKFEEGISNCKKVGGILAEPRDAGEVKAFFKVSGGNKAWIGASDREEEGKFKWLSDNKEMTFTHWNGGEPNNYGSGEDCGQANWSGDRWNDISCNSRQKYVCQTNPITVWKGAN